MCTKITLRTEAYNLCLKIQFELEITIYIKNEDVYLKLQCVLKITICTKITMCTKKYDVN